MRLRARPTVIAAMTLVGGVVLPLAVPLCASPAYARPPRGDGAHIAQHSLRKGVTDEDFYFLMADRFANGDRGNDSGGLGNDPLVSGFDPKSKGVYNGGGPQGGLSEPGYNPGPRAGPILATPSVKNKAGQVEGGPSAGDP